MDASASVSASAASTAASAAASCQEDAALPVYTPPQAAHVTPTRAHAERFIVDNPALPEAARAHKRRLETEPASRTNHLAYQPGMEVIDSDIKDKVLAATAAFDASAYTANDVERALASPTCSIEDFKALLSPAAAPYLERMAARAERETRNHFGNTVYIFTPLYIANYCQNYCVYCGFNCYNDIHRKRLTPEEIEHEMQVIAATGMEEILILTGESRAHSDVHFIGEAVSIARKYFRNIGVEIYPVNTDEYAYLHECGVDYVTVFQETYNPDAYEQLHLAGHKRVWPYRFDAQERALRAGMRGVAFSALLGLDDFRTDALATALHAYYLNRAYPHAELSLSCPRLRPIVGNAGIGPNDVGEAELCQILCAYRIFMPFVGITVSSRESARFRDGIVKICATKVSAGVSTGIGDHEEKYDAAAHGTPAEPAAPVSKIAANAEEPRNGACHATPSDGEDAGDEQFEIDDDRSIEAMCRDMAAGGLQPVLNDYVYV